MTFRHVAIVGRARAGKDTVAARLVFQHSYTRVAFADALKTAALDLDPIIRAEGTPLGVLPVRLSDLVHRHGWERCKVEHAEVRRTLQRLGEAVRRTDSGHWVRVAVQQLDTADSWGLPVVVSDVRYRNELSALRDRGALVVRVERPGAGAGAGVAERLHVSETELDDAPADVTITNSGTLADLFAAVDALPLRH
ncbi:hypothetical protein [Streptomyces sp. NBC_00102]|uniref:deoxynucleotide monophosphate kinase family protein n=1 Tax=Streptomyces sp. NBC_00102 TaxID=2975652 RepID=UPI00224D75DC|nr:hypothetical protein [Streptomyces sp. NBC_00102]MCX5398475.1 hypothetical protein [Streptomyces sp. NBC_00102]